MGREAWRYQDFVCEVAAVSDSNCSSLPAFDAASVVDPSVVRTFPPTKEILVPIHSIPPSNVLRRHSP